MKIFIAIVLLIFPNTASIFAEDKPPPSVAADNPVTWRMIKKIYGNESITYIISGNLQLLEKENETGSNWSGTGTAIGLDDQARIRFMATYLNSKRDGSSISISEDKMGPHELDWNQWSNGKNLTHSYFLWSKDGKLLLNGAAVPIEEK